MIFLFFFVHESFRFGTLYIDLTKGRRIGLLDDGMYACYTAECVLHEMSVENDRTCPPLDEDDNLSWLSQTCTQWAVDGINQFMQVFKGR